MFLARISNQVVSLRSGILGSDFFCPIHSGAILKYILLYLSKRLSENVFLKDKDKGIVVYTFKDFPAKVYG